MARCKVAPEIRNYDLAADPATTPITFDADTVAFVLRCRTPVGLKIRLAGKGDYFSLGAGETYSEEGLKLEDSLALEVSAASAAVLEVWSWGA